VRTDYDWTTLIRRGQVEAVLNYVATGDFVVACFPGALEILNWQDLGSAGHNGFKDSSPRVFQCRYISGGHGAALTETNWEDIANFITSDSPQNSTTPERRDKQNVLVLFLGRIAPLVWVLIAGTLASAGFGLWRFNSHEPIRTLFLLAYLLIDWQILTRV